MSDTKSKAETIQNVLNKLKDLENNYNAVIEKTGILVLELMDESMDSIADKLNDTITETSNNNEIVKEIYGDLEIERNKIKNEG